MKSNLFTAGAPSRLRWSLAPLLLEIALAAPLLAAEPAAHWWDAAVETALAAAAENRAELQQALLTAPAEQRTGMSFLVANMPPQDLQQLKADYLLTNCKLAYQAKAETAWGKQIPDEVFLNNVLPYANLDEQRDNWRQELHTLCLPIVKDCETSSAAALKLNQELFPLLKVRYSTSRRAPNQAPQETMESGVATCTGLSILLVDACRAVGIPARVVGTPLWTNKRGNHTWVEIWDNGWRFTGACEAGDGASLDTGWFVGDAATALEDNAEHAIYAASFQKTPLSFPMVWAGENQSVSAVNVTRRYTQHNPADPTLGKVCVKVLDAEGRRVAVAVAIGRADADKALQSGRSRGETADLNDLLGFELPPGQEFTLRLEGVERTVKSPAAGKHQVIEIQLSPKS